WEGQPQDIPISGINRKDFAKLLAWYISDGSIYGNKVQIAKEKQPHKSILEKTLTPLGFRYSGNRFFITNKEWAEYFKKFGKCHDKYLPDWIKNETREIIRVFLEAYILGDGYSKTNNYKGHDFESVTYFTTSDKLSSDLGEVI